MIPRLQERYKKEIIPEMARKFGYKNTMQVPRIKKITINMGVGAGAQDKKLIEDAQAELALIAGQKPVITRAKKAIANFKIREGSAVGCSVTLRKAHMYEFLDRLINVALPRIKDFRGVSNKSFDKDGNFSLGITEQSIFTELDMDKVTKIKGMSVTVTLTKCKPEESRELLRFFGMPFARK